jgi:hypothetical protein
MTNTPSSEAKPITCWIKDEHNVVETYQTVHWTKPNGASERFYCEESYQALEQRVKEQALEIESWSEGCDRDRRRIADLEAKLAKAREALKFYADEGNWYHPDVYSSKYRCIDVSDMEYDDELDHHNYKEVGGKTARKALESIGE